MFYMFNRFVIITVCSLFFTKNATAGKYSFDASMLKRGGEGIDMALFEEGGQQPGIYPVNIILNGDYVGSENITFYSKKDKDGKYYLKSCLTQDMLTRYGIKTEEYPNLFNTNSRNNEHRDDCAELSVIPHAAENYQYAAQQLALSIPQVAFRNRLTGIAPENLWDDGIPAFLMPWQLDAGRSEYRIYGKKEDENLWIQLEPGLNIGPWRVRNLTTWNKSSGQSGKWESSYTRAERGLNRIKSRLTLGENYTTSDIFDSVPFVGVSVGSDENMVPYNQREFAPVVRGIARTQARIEVRQNGYLIHSQTIAPGAFSLTSLPMTGSGGDLQVTVLESDGAIQQFTVPFTTPAISVREGYLKYNVTAGQYRSLDKSIEKTYLGQATAVYGLPWALTAFGGLQGSEYYQGVALGLGWSLGYFGAISLDTIYSRGQPKGDNYKKGETWRVRYNNFFESTGTGFTVSNQYSSEGYHSLSDVLDTYYDSNSFIYNKEDNRMRRTTININQTIGRWGYVGLNGFQDEYRHKTRENYIGMSYGTSWNNISLSVNWLRNRNNVTSSTEDNFSIWMNIPLERWLGGMNNDINATAQIQRSSKQNSRYEMGLNGRAFEQRLYWDFRQQRVQGSEYDADNSRLRLRWSGTYGEVTGMYSYSSNIRQMNVGMSGNMVVHNEGITFGQKSGDTMSLIVAPGVSGASVNGWPGVSTDFRGYGLVSYISPYQENILSLDPITFPENAEMAQTERSVVPTKGAVVRTEFQTRVGNRAVVTLTRKDGVPLPFGTVVTLEGKMDETFGSAGVVDDKGDVYLSGLSETGKLKAQWGMNSKCYADYRLPEEKGDAGIFLTRAICM